MNPTDEKRVENLLSWGRQHGATLHESVEIYRDKRTQFSLKIKDSTSSTPAPGFTAVQCPASITLSYLNALTDGQPLSTSTPDGEHEPSFPSSFMASLPPHVIGRFFLIQQYLRGAFSFWAPYIQTLPEPQNLSSWTLPAFWPSDDIAFLDGTNAHVAIREIQANVKREFKQARKLLQESGFPGWQDYSRLLYNWAFCMFTSRSFRPETVLSEEMREGISKSLNLQCRFDDFSVLMPVFDIANHSLAANPEWDTTSDPSTCRLVSRDGYRPGQQIYNNYGSKSNGELLLGYGFIIAETEELHNDYIHVRKGAEPPDDAAKSGQGSKPRDFLISLRPMLDPSSRVGISRQRVKLPENSVVLPELAHVEDSLIWDLAVVQAADDERLSEALAQIGGGDADECLRKLLGRPTEPQLVYIVDRIKKALLSKMWFDYGRLKEAEVDENGEMILSPINHNQQLAVAYRAQCEKVLAIVITLLGGGIG